MSECIYCQKSPLLDTKVVLFRTAPKGTIPAGWICEDCCNKFLELTPETNLPHFLHSNSCDGGCDYDCNNPTGFNQAEVLKESLGYV